MRGGGKCLWQFQLEQKKCLLRNATSGRGRGLRWTGRRAAWVPNKGVKNLWCRGHSWRNDVLWLKFEPEVGEDQLRIVTKTALSRCGLNFGCSTFLGGSYWLPLGDKPRVDRRQNPLLRTVASPKVCESTMCFSLIASVYLSHNYLMPES